MSAEKCDSRVKPSSILANISLKANTSSASSIGTSRGSSLTSSFEERIARNLFIDLANRQVAPLHRQPSHTERQAHDQAGCPPEHALELRQEVEMKADVHGSDDAVAGRR